MCLQRTRSVVLCYSHLPARPSFLPRNTRRPTTPRDFEPRSSGPAHAASRARVGLVCREAGRWRRHGLMINAQGFTLLLGKRSLYVAGAVLGTLLPVLPAAPPWGRRCYHCTLSHEDVPKDTQLPSGRAGIPSPACQPPNLRLTSALQPTSSTLSPGGRKFSINLSWKSLLF